MYMYVCTYHLFTETEGNSELCGNERSRGHKTHCFPEVSVNKCFAIIASVKEDKKKYITEENIVKIFRIICFQPSRLFQNY